MVRVVVASALGGGTVVQRPWLGAKLQAVTPEIADSLALRRPAGALVASVLANSPAAKGGLRVGDLIVAIDGLSVEDPNTFNYRFGTKPLGGRAQVQVVRGGREMAVSLALQTAPDGPREELVITSPAPFMGAKVSNLSPALAEELRIDDAVRGVVVVDVAVGSPAQRVGFQRGDVINAVNGDRIGRTRDLERVSATSPRLWRITLTRGGRQRTVTLGG
jgi:S1-C subfamily serine protease